MIEFIANALGFVFIVGIFFVLGGVARGGGQGPTWRGRL